MGYWKPTVNVGHLHLFRSIEGKVLPMLGDATVTTTFETLDWRDYVPVGTKAIYIKTDNYTDTSQGILVLRNYGSAEISGNSWVRCATPASLMRWQIGAYGENRRTGYGMMVTDGRFEYAEYSTTWKVTTVYISLMGYYL